nr:otolith matrix protein OMM-64-like [Aegilops tauschii subsp. strangulata]
MCEYTGDLKDPQRHCDIQLSDAEITEATKKLLNEPLKECSKTGLSPFCTFNKPPAAYSLWKKKPQDKPAKPARTKTKATKRPAKKKTTESADLNLDDDKDDDKDDDESEDDAEASRADGVEGTSHSSSGESTRTQILTFKTVPGGQAKPSKKAKLNKPVDVSNPSEPEKQQLEPSNPIAEATLDDPPPQDHEASIDHMDVEPTISKPPIPIKPAKEKTNDVVVTGFGFTAPGHSTVLSKHSTKEEISAEDKGKWKAELVEKDTQLNDLKANVKTQQAETSKAKSELKRL